MICHTTLIKQKAVALARDVHTDMHDVTLNVHVILNGQKKQQKEKKEVYKKYTADSTVDSYRIEGLQKGKKKWKVT